MSDTHAAATADAKPKASAEAQVAERVDDLDSALAEFEDSTPKSEPAPKPKAAALTLREKVETLASFVEDERAAKVKAQAKEDFTKSVEKIHEDEDLKHLPRLTVEDRIFRAIADDKRIYDAWLRRSENPSAWERVLVGIGKTLKDNFASKIDRDVTRDRQTAMAAARTSTRPRAEAGIDPAEVASAKGRALDDLVKKTIAKSKKARG